MFNYLSCFTPVSVGCKDLHCNEILLRLFIAMANFFMHVKIYSGLSSLEKYNPKETGPRYGEICIPHSTQGRKEFGWSVFTYHSLPFLILI